MAGSPGSGRRSGPHIAGVSGVVAVDLTFDPVDAGWHDRASFPDNFGASVVAGSQLVFRRRCCPIGQLRLGGAFGVAAVTEARRIGVHRFLSWKTNDAHMLGSARQSTGLFG